MIDTYARLHDGTVAVCMHTLHTFYAQTILLDSLDLVDTYPSLHFFSVTVCMHKITCFYVLEQRLLDITDGRHIC